MARPKEKYPFSDSGQQANLGLAILRCFVRTTLGKFQLLG